MDADRLQQVRNHARLLAVFHYILGGMILLSSLFFLLYVVMAVFFVFADLPTTGNDPPIWLMGMVFAGFGTCGGIIVIAMGVANLVAGFALTGTRSPTLILIVAVINMLNQPFGLVLGILTLLFILQADVKELFSSNDDDEALV